VCAADRRRHRWFPRIHTSAAGPVPVNPAIGMKYVVVKSVSFHATRSTVLPVPTDVTIPAAPTAATGAIVGDPVRDLRHIRWRTGRTWVEPFTT
jgi:hypothetical protein